MYMHIIVLTLRSHYNKQMPLMSSMHLISLTSIFDWTTKVIPRIVMYSVPFHIIS